MPVTQKQIDEVKRVMNDGSRIDRLLLRSLDGGVYTSDSHTDGNGDRSPSVAIPVAETDYATDEDVRGLIEALEEQE